MPTDLEKRFKESISGAPSVEIVDDIIPLESFPGVQRADYYLLSRSARFSQAE